ncbi:MAG: FtsW/RodA/SpoVE family cell cycle protein [Victivallales bacterium]|nr:FtsW/RodA/SpoVE family cell cycle protein [Victivallales bacterium]
MNDKTKENIDHFLPHEAFKLQIMAASVLLVMALWGCLAIYNATVLSDEPFLFPGKQMLWLAISLAVMLAAANTPFDKIIENLRVLAAISLASLVSVLLLGVRINAMRGWFDLGICHIQPSEISKPIFVLTLCFVANSAKNNLSMLIRTSAVTLLWCLPLSLQPDFGTMAVYLAAFLSVYFCAGGRMLVLAPAFAAIPPAIILLCQHKPYVAARIAGFISPESLSAGPGWHILQFQYTMARGGISGQSWGRALWANAYLPLAYSDSTFASIVEAVGFLGALPVIVGFCALVFFSYKLAVKTPAPLPALFIATMPVTIAIQALLHMSVNVTMLPVTGITLPVISYGGSSLLATFLSFGIMISASKPQRRHL